MYIRICTYIYSKGSYTLKMSVIITAILAQWQRSSPFTVETGVRDLKTRKAFCIILNTFLRVKFRNGLPLLTSHFLVVPGTQEETKNQYIHTYTYIYVYSGIYLRIHAYTCIYIVIRMYTSINRDILTIYMHIHTQKYSICMYMYVYNGFSFLLASQARLGNERAGEEGRSGISIAKRYSK